MPEEAPVMSMTLPLKSSFLRGFTKAHMNSFTGIERGMYIKMIIAAEICITTLWKRR